ncbi:PEP-CTERM sorting domain-containing protein [Methylomonas sp. AM2-LC]|uniref:PEP-CTERM sorting domain-containing protein n=1 Tax=Methylomonas sp. AM2-LC TaxID=3153301 RepID=UPI0032654B63
MNLRDFLAAIVLSSTSLVAQADGYNFTTVSTPSGFTLIGINNNGESAGTFNPSSGGALGVFYNTANNFYLTFSNPNTTISPSDTFGNGINNSGQIVGSYFIDLSAPYIENSYIYNGSGFTNLSDPNITTGSQQYTIANGINDNATVVGAYNSQSNGWIGFEYSNGVYTDIIDSNAYQTSANAINNSGAIVGSLAFSGTAVGSPSYVNSGFIDIGGVFTLLNDPNAASNSYGTVATGINNLGEVVGYYYDATGITHGFLYNAGVYTTIDFTGLSINKSTTLSSINDLGQIAGNTSDGTVLHSFIASPATVPVPTTVWLFGSALAGFIGFNRRKSVQQAI